MQRFQLTLCHFTPQLVEDLSQGLINCEQLQVLDLSYNNMSDQCGAMFGKVLKRQAQMRDQHLWMASLRGRDALKDEIGLKEFNLRCNKLGAETIRALASIIAENETIRVLDLRENGITERPLLDELIPELRQNETLTNLDLRGNPGYSQRVHRLVADCLLANISKLKRANPPTIGKNWLNKHLLSEDNPEEQIEHHVPQTRQEKRPKAPKMIPPRPASGVQAKKPVEKPRAVASKNSHRRNPSRRSDASGLSKADGMRLLPSTYTINQGTRDPNAYEYEPVIVGQGYDSDGLPERDSFGRVAGSKINSSGMSKCLCTTTRLGPCFDRASPQRSPPELHQQLLMSERQELEREVN